MAQSLFDIVLVAPQIAGNTGAIIRLAANLGARLHLVEPLGFHFEEAALRRAGLDYHDLVDTTVWPSWEECRSGVGTHDRWFATTGHGALRHSDVQYRSGDVFVFGCESDGLPTEVLQQFERDRVVSIPMRPTNRSINLANAVAIVTFEAWRQLGWPGAVEPGSSVL